MVVSSIIPRWVRLRHLPVGKSKALQLRTNGSWMENLHWVRDPQTDEIYYNAPLIDDYIANLANPEGHRRACEHYVASLPSNQAKSKSSQSKAVAA